MCEHCGTDCFEFATRGEVCGYCGCYKCAGGCAAEKEFKEQEEKMLQEQKDYNDRMIREMQEWEQEMLYFPEPEDLLVADYDDWCGWNGDGEI